VLTETNIQSAFRATGLVPHNPERVISLLAITKTPSPSDIGIGLDIQWTGETSHNLHQLDQQAQFLRDTIQCTSQNPTQAVDQLVKGFQLVLHSAVILQQENTRLKTSNQRRERKQQQRRQYIAHGGTLQAQQGQFLVQQRENREQEQEARQASTTKKRAPSTCSRCHVQGHNIRQCPQVINNQSN